MNPLLKKEIRLLLPAWVLTLLLAVLPPLWHRQTSDSSDFMAPLFFGILILCASSFGREFSLGTFSSMMAQPFSRKHYWFTKVGVLLVALLSALLVSLQSVVLLHVTFAGDGPTAITVGMFLLSAVAGGLWLALLVRQIIAVIWLIVLIPLIACLPVLLVLSHFNAADKTVENTLNAVLLVYSVGGITASWLIFRRAQDAPWSGGTISLPDWMSASMPLSSSATRLRQPPLRALIRKEFHFNQAPLLGVGVLFLLYLGVVGLRFLHRHPLDAYWRDMNDTLRAFGILWVIAPLVIGCTSIAEERKLGMLEGQLCMPVSSRRQFMVKLGFILIIGGLLSAGLLLGVERLGEVIGLSPDLNSTGSVAAVVAGMMAVALISFFASSLTRNILQALPVTIAVVVGLALIFVFFDRISGFDNFFLIPGFRFWNPLLPILLTVIPLVFVLPWLAYRNFRCLHETRRIWWRNGIALASVLVFAMVASLILFHRLWEKLTPQEPAHGTARWTMAARPVSERTEFGNNLHFTLPDGRSWFGSLGYSHRPDPGIIPNYLMGPPAIQMNVHQFMSGSDWKSLATAYADFWIEPENQRSSESKKPIYKHIVGGRETVGVRADGTL